MRAKNSYIFNFPRTLQVQLADLPVDLPVPNPVHVFHLLPDPSGSLVEPVGRGSTAEHGLTRRHSARTAARHSTEEKGKN